MINSPPAYVEPIKYEEIEPVCTHTIHPNPPEKLVYRKTGYEKRPGFWIILILMLASAVIFYFGYTMESSDSITLRSADSDQPLAPFNFSFWPAKISLCVSSVLGMAVLLMMLLDPDLTLTNKYYTRLFVPIAFFFAFFMIGIGHRCNLKEYIQSTKTKSTNYMFAESWREIELVFQKQAGIILVKYTTFGLLFGALAAYLVLLIWTIPEDYEGFAGFLRCLKPYQPKKKAILVQ